MHRYRWLLIAAALFLIVSLAAAQNGRRFVILSATQGPGSTSFAGGIVAAGGTLVRNMEGIGVVVAASTNPAFAQSVAALPGVDKIAEDMEVQWLPNTKVGASAEASAVPNGVNTEPFFPYQWNIRHIRADMTAANGHLGNGAVVAVLDSGCFMNHLDLAPNVDAAHATSFVPDEPGVQPPPGAFNHGTHVAGIVASAINNKGIQGVAPQAKIVPVKVLRFSGSGAFSWIISGIMYAADLKADVINMSLSAVFDRNNAGGGGAGPLISAVNRAVNYATASGTLVVSAAGNNALDLDSRIVVIPAQSGNGMAVSATGPILQQNFDHLASYSNYGRSVINVAAPGGNDESCCVSGWYLDMVLSTSAVSADGITHYYSWAEGTSMAAPHVAGLAALLVGKYGKLPPATLKAMIEQSAVDILKPGSDAETGRGRIDAWNALK